MVNLKEFFKPTKVKLLLSLIVFIVFVPVLSTYIQVYCDMPPCPLVATGNKVPFIFMLFGGPLYSYKTSLDAATLIFGFIISYTASCLIAPVCSNNTKNR